MLTAKEQELIERVRAEHAKYMHLEANPPHEQDNIPNPFEVLTREELYYLREHPYLQDILEDYFKQDHERIKREQS